MQGGDTANVIGAGLPNITGLFRGTPCTTASGAFSRSDNSDPALRVPANQEEINKSIFSLIQFRASDSSENAAAVYGKSSTVQPAAIRLIPQIRF